MINKPIQIALLIVTNTVGGALFVGGVADQFYIETEVNDIDIVIEDVKDLSVLSQYYKIKSSSTDIFDNVKEYYQVSIKIGKETVNLDAFVLKEDIEQSQITQSSLLGQRVRHVNREYMQEYHSKSLERLGRNYDTREEKRLKKIWNKLREYKTMNNNKK